MLVNINSILLNFVANCTAGQYRNNETNVCHLCPKGQYQPNWWQEACIPCDPDGHKTTDGMGATSEDQCRCEFMGTFSITVSFVWCRHAISIGIYKWYIISRFQHKFPQGSYPKYFEPFHKPIYSVNNTHKSQAGGVVLDVPHFASSVYKPTNLKYFGGVTVAEW